MNHSSNNLPGTPNEDAFLALIPRFLVLISKFVRKDRIRRGSEVNELVNEFYLEVWPGIKVNHDSQKGDLGGYAYVSFRNFLIKRSIQTSQHKERFTGLDQIVTDPSDSSSDEIDLSQHDRIRLDRALNQVPKEDKQILLDFCNAKRPSIRALVRKEGGSRYAAEQRLMSAFGRLLMTYEKPDKLPHINWQVSRLILVNHCSVPQTARELRLGEQQVRKLHKETMRMIASLLKKQYSP